MLDLVSVVIPTYNRSKDLKRALKSVLSQTYKNWEVVVVDNNSTDDTDAMLKDLNDQRIRLLKINNNGVIAASRNLGIYASNGKWIAFLDSDDWWTSQKLELSVKALEGGADVVYHDMLLATKPNQQVFLSRARTRRLQSPVFKDLIVGGNDIVTSSVIIKKTIFNKIKGFKEDQDLIAIEDYDAWLRVAKITNNFEKIPKALGYYWIGGGNTSNPKRTIQVLNSFEKNYKKEISDLNVHRHMYWLNYNRAMAFYILNKKKQAKKIFKIALNRHPILIIKIKCIVMIFIINIQFFLKGNNL